MSPSIQRKLSLVQSSSAVVGHYFAIAFFAASLAGVIEILVF